MDPRRLTELGLDTPSNYWTAASTRRRQGRDSLEIQIPLCPTDRDRQDTEQAEMATQRKRLDRGRNGGNGEEQAEQGIWDECQDSIRKIVELVKRSEECKNEIFQMESDLNALAGSKSTRAGE